MPAILSGQQGLNLTGLLVGTMTPFVGCREVWVFPNMCCGCGIHQGVAKEEACWEGESIPSWDQERLRTMCQHPRAIQFPDYDGERYLAGTGKKGSLPWMGGCYQQSSAGTETTQHWPKEQVSKVSHICGLLENALETETSKAKDEESGPWIPLSLGLSFGGFVCMGYVSIFKAPRPRSSSPVKPPWRHSG